MKKFNFLILLIPFLLKAQVQSVPLAKKEPEKFTIHGHTRIDQYYWMNQRDSEDVLKYIAEENKVSSDFLKQKPN